MCIALFSTAHPDYALVLINNRDEFLNRPTAPAAWWACPHENVLGGRDLQREEQGTWLGITKQGRVAVLTNFREEGDFQTTARSRGAIVNAFLTQSPESSDDTKRFVENLVEGEGLKGVGGFSLAFGKVGEPLAVISNRTPNADAITWIAKERGETIGLSNSAIADRSWVKVTRGEQLLSSVIEQSVAAPTTQDALIDHLFEILSDDTLPRIQADKVASMDSYVKALRESIFIPAFGRQGGSDMSAQDLATARSDRHVDVQQTTQGRGLSGKYGTQKQTVVLVDRGGRVTFVERTLFDSNGETTGPTTRDRLTVFDVEDWNSR